MNERIKELWDKVDIQEEGNPPSIVITSKRELQEFAELIVRECMDIAIHKDDSMISTADIAGYMAAGRVTAAKMIAKHFGVQK